MEVSNNSVKRKKFEFPHAFALMIMIVLVLSLLSYVIPSSTYTMMEVEYTLDDGTVSTRSVVDPDGWSLSEEDKSISFMQFITSFYRGMLEVPDIIFFIFLVVGAFYIVGETGAITSGVGRLILKLGNKKIALIPVLVFIFAFLGSTAGIYEEMLAFIPILAPLLIAAGYDSLLTIGIVMGGGAAGFAGATTNGFTLAVAQGIAGLPIYSGLWYHVIVFVCFVVLLSIMLMVYAKKLEKDQSKSIMYEGDKVYLQNNHVDFASLPEFNTTRKIILVEVLATIGIMVFGIMKYGWYFQEISGIFLVMGVVVTFTYGKGINWFCNNLVAGMKTIVTGAMIVGFARAILVILNDSEMIHTILHSASGFITSLPAYMAVVGQYIFQCLMNYIIPSGSGQASATMPIMAPLADLTGINRQVAVQCEVIGDALSNPFTPTSGNIHAGLAMAGIPWATWAKFWWKFLAIEYLLGLVLVIIADMIELGPF